MSMIVDEVVLSPDGSLVFYDDERRTNKCCPDASRGKYMVHCGIWCPFLEINELDGSRPDGLKWEIIFRCRPQPATMCGFMICRTQTFKDLRPTPKEELDMMVADMKNDLLRRERTRKLLEQRTAAEEAANKPTLKETKECDRKHPVD